MFRRTRSTTTSIQGLLPSLGGALDFLWTRIDGEEQARPAERVWFSGPAGREGTTTIAIRAALGIAEHLRERVILVEGNFIRPALARYFDLPPTPGLAEYVLGEAELEDVVRPTETHNLCIVPAGDGRRTVPGDLATHSAGGRLAQLAVNRRFLLFDAPPVLVHTESRLLLCQADRAVLVFHAGQTTKRDARRSRAIVEGSGVKLLGAVMNRYRPEIPAWVERRLAP